MSRWLYGNCWWLTPLSNPSLGREELSSTDDTLVVPSHHSSVPTSNLLMCLRYLMHLAPNRHGTLVTKRPLSHLVSVNAGTSWEIICLQLLPKDIKQWPCSHSMFTFPCRHLQCLIHVACSGCCPNPAILNIYITVDIVCYCLCTHSNLQWAQWF